MPFKTKAQHLAAIVVALPSTLVGQATFPPHRWEFGAVAGHVTADGNDFQNIKDAFGYGGVLHVQVVRGFSAGLGIHYSDHGLVGLPEHLHIRAVYAEGRYRWRVARSPISAFLGVRGGPVHEDITIVHWKGKGTVLGITTGLNWQVAPHLGIELQAGESALRFGDIRGADGSIMPGTAARGSSLDVHAGLFAWF